MKCLLMLFVGALLGLIGGTVATITSTEAKAKVSLEECTINKPSGTACVYEGGYIAKEVK